MLAKQPSFVPTLRTLQQLDEGLSAKPLTPEHVAEVEATAPAGSVAGTRYAAPQRAALDSEKGRLFQKL